MDGYVIFEKEFFIKRKIFETMNTRMSFLATILMLSSSLFAKDYLISTSRTSLLISAEVGEKSKIQYYGVAIAPEQIQHIYDAGLALN